MADFEKSFKRVVFNEGGYVNDPDDAGGETYMGISRRAYPNSIIWKHIDEITKKYMTIKIINQKLKENTELTEKIKAIYKSDYWMPFNLDKGYSQRLADQIFDNAVNRGVASTKKLIQRIKNEMEMFKK